MESSEYGTGYIIALILIYLLPTFIASLRKHRNGIAIFVLNIFAGWTLFGWIGALVWAFTANTEKSPS